ncbi:MAG: hypothetical protein PHD61_03370 [Bacteroidales bacterium]|nr:hypothetical protein [Lentimicrobiaceae bacterium]MDD5694326.1 hypothetical protein [Bacteroidales bacterium]
MKKLMIALTLVAFVGATAFGQAKSSTKVVSNETKIEKVALDQDPVKAKDGDKVKSESSTTTPATQSAAPAKTGSTQAHPANCGTSKPAGCEPKPGCPAAQKGCCSKSQTPPKK